MWTTSQGGCRKRAALREGTGRLGPRGPSALRSGQASPPRGWARRSTSALSTDCSVPNPYWLEKEVSPPTRRHSDCHEHHLLLKDFQAASVHTRTLPPGSSRAAPRICKDTSMEGVGVSAMRLPSGSTPGSSPTGCHSPGHSQHLPCSHF